jgi:hypothetical protein
MPAPVPAEPFGRPARWPLLATIGAVATLVGVMGVVVVVKSTTSRAQTPSPATGITAPPAAVALPPSSAAPHGPEPAPVALAKHQVLVSVSPSDAMIARDGKELGQSPVALELVDGEKAVLVLTRKGYRPKTVTVVPSDTKPSFALEPAAASAPKGPAPKPASVGASDDIGDPFASHR